MREVREDQINRSSSHPDSSSSCFNTPTGPPTLLEIRLALIAVSIKACFTISRLRGIHPITTKDSEPLVTVKKH